RRLRRQWRDRRGGPRDGGCAEDAVHASAGRGVAARRGPAGTGRRGRAADDRPRRGRRLATRAGCGARTRRGWCGGRRVPVAVRACARRATEAALPVRAGPQPVTPRWTRPPARRTPGRVCFLPGSSPIATKKECRMQSVIRSAAVAGTFYPAQPDALRSGIVRWLSEATPVQGAGDESAPKLLVVPHAGHVYSGPVAAQAYALLAPWRERISRVVLLGPTHRVPVRGLAAPTVAAFDTPLGPVAVDRAAIAALAGLPQVAANDLAHAHEHSLEVQLPFLQAVLARFSIVPLAVGRASAGEVAEVLERLWGGDETLFVISSDLSHYLPYAQ